MNAVGIDVSKGRSMVAILRPGGEIVSKPFVVRHLSREMHSLIELIKSLDGESRIVMEHTGRYYESIARELSEAGLFVSAVNPKLIWRLRRTGIFIFRKRYPVSSGINFPMKRNMQLAALPHRNNHHKHLRLALLYATITSITI